MLAAAAMAMKWYSSSSTTYTVQSQCEKMYNTLGAAIGAQFLLLLLD